MKRSGHTTWQQLTFLAMRTTLANELETAVVVELAAFTVASLVVEAAFTVAS